MCVAPLNLLLRGEIPAPLFYWRAVEFALGLIRQGAGSSLPDRFPRPAALTHAAEASDRVSACKAMLPFRFAAPLQLRPSFLRYSLPRTPLHPRRSLSERLRL